MSYTRTPGGVAGPLATGGAGGTFPNLSDRMNKPHTVLDRRPDPETDPLNCCGSTEGHRADCITDTASEEER